MIAFPSQSPLATVSSAATWNLIDSQRQDIHINEKDSG